jgi:hypothetical protein
MRKCTWKVVDWASKGKRKADGELELACPRCFHDAFLPTCGKLESPIIAAVGLGLIFDRPSYVPPRGYLPDEIQCRNCRRVFGACDG